MIEKIFTYDLTDQTVTDNSLRDLDNGQSITQYNLGQILVNFLNYDFSLYDKSRKKANKIFAINNYTFGYNEDSFDNDDDYEKYEKYIDKIVQKIFPNISSIYFEITEHDSLLALAFYLLDLIHGIPYCQDYSFLSFKQFIDGENFDFQKIQDDYKDLFINCLDVDINPEYTPIQKYLQFYNKSFIMDGGVSFTEKTIFRYRYSRSELADYIKSIYPEVQTVSNEAFVSIYPELKNKTHNPEIIYRCHNFIESDPRWKECETEVIHGYSFETISEALLCEFLKMLELGIKIRKCTVCGKYFIITGHNGKCCDNLYKDTGLTCQQVFADRNYKNKRKKNPVLKEYDKAYKRMYARYSSKKNLTSDKYAKWKNEAAQERDKALKAYAENPSDTVINNFKQFLNNK